MKTKRVSLPYGKGWLKAEVPSRNLVTVAEPKPIEPIPDPRSALERTLEEPIASESLLTLAEDCRKPCIIVSDSTRPTPSGLITETVLKTLNDAGVSDHDVKVVIATGLHRASTAEELRERLGAAVFRRVGVVNHYARDADTLVEIGRTSRGTPVWINEVVNGCDLVIGDGYIEPHFFAGYTGGGKNILPGVSGFETIKANHGTPMIDHPEARAGILCGNPVYEEIVEGAKLGGLDFSINVTLDPQKRVSGIFTGEFEEAHRKGAHFLDERVKVGVPRADIVITTNGGFPLDRDLYQAVKGMTVGEAVVKEGGVTVIASECVDGVGHPDFRELVENHETPEEILETIRTPGFFMVDQWEAQILARVLIKCEVICVTGVAPQTIRKMHMTPARDIGEALEIAMDKVGRSPEIVAVPGGPSIIPTVQ
ncbi:MAG: nickel-dependent lactate racemase [Candidatus Bathyarchaeota archaeon]